MSDEPCDEAVMDKAIEQLRHGESGMVLAVAQMILNRADSGNYLTPGQFMRAAVAGSSLVERMEATGDPLLKMAHGRLMDAFRVMLPRMSV